MDGTDVERVEKTVGVAGHVETGFVVREIAKKN
jgi:hypothetical protein